MLDPFYPVSSSEIGIVNENVVGKDIPQEDCCIEKVCGLDFTKCTGLTGSPSHLEFLTVYITAMIVKADVSSWLKD